MASIADDEKAPLAFTASATVTSSADIPLRSDGSLDATQINVSDRDQRAAFVAQLPDLCRSYGSNDTVDILLPAMIEACQFDDAALAIATSLAEVGNSIRPERSPLKEMEELLRELFDNVDGHIGSAAAKAAVDFVSSADTTDEERLMFVGMVSKLAAGGQGISAKCAAAAMLPAAHSAALHLANTATIKSPPNPGKASTVIVVTDANGSNDYESKRRVVRTKALFSDLIRDASSAVRRAAAASLAEWLNQISTATATPDVLPQVKAWATDLIRDRLQDSVRFAALPHLVAIARLSPTQEWNSIVQLAVAAAKDPAWRVRWTAARHLVSLMLVMPSLATALLPSLQALAKDEEAEVRSCVAQRLGEAASTLSQQIVSAELVPLAIAFSTDEHPTVTAAAAGSVCDVCRCCTDADVGKLVDIITHFIEDPSDTVQLNVLRSLPNMKDRLADRVVMQRITSLLSTVSQVSVSRWRVRERVGEQLRHLAHYVTLDDAATFESMLHQLVDDPVAAVRLTAIGSLPLVAAHFGPAWTRAHLERFGDRLTSGYRERQMYVAVLDAMLPFASYMPRSSSMLRTSSSADHQSPTVAANSSAAPGAASNPTTSGSPQRSLTVSASDGLSGSPAPGSRSPLAPMASFASAGSSDPTEVAFWNHVRSDLNTLAKDSVANVRLAVCRWAFAPSSARTLQLADLRAALQLSFGTDTCEEVRAAAMNAVAGKSLTMDPF